MKKYIQIIKEITIPVDIGSEILHGKFKNKKGTVKSFTWSEKGDLIAELEGGKQISILKIRLKKK